MKKILVVDDTFISRATAERILREQYSVLMADSGQACLSILAKEQVDLVLLDMEMPIMNGIETLTQIRRLSGGKNLPVIMVTGNDDRETVVAAVELSIEDYLVKPYMPEDLLRRVRKCIQG